MCQKHQNINEKLNLTKSRISKSNILSSKVCFFLFLKSIYKFSGSTKSNVTIKRSMTYFGVSYEKDFIKVLLQVLV